MSGNAKRELLARLGLENEAHLTAASDGSSRKGRKVEKMMVAELHNMQGELAVERSSLRNENQALRDAIEQLRATTKASAAAEKPSKRDVAGSTGTSQEGDIVMEEVG